MQKLFPTILIVLLMCALAFAERKSNYTPAEEEVIWLVEMCEQQASIGEHTDGMSRDNMELFISECEEAIASTYNISRTDIRYLLFNKRNNIPFPNEYKKPTMPTNEEKGRLNNEIKELMKHYEELDRAGKQAFEIRKKYGVGQ